MTLCTYKNFREKHEYKLVFSQNLEEDFEELFLNIKNYSQTEYEATYVLSLIKNAILELKNPFISGVIPYSIRIANLGYRQYPIIGGSYIIFFLTDQSRKVRMIDYVKPACTNYELQIF